MLRPGPGRAGLKYRWRQLDVRQRFGTGTGALHLCATVSLDSRSKTAAAGEGIGCVTVKITTFEEQAPSRAHTQDEATMGGEAASDRKPPNV